MGSRATNAAFELDNRQQILGAVEAHRHNTGDRIKLRIVMQGDPPERIVCA